MELVEFMSNKECVVETFKVNLFFSGNVKVIFF